MNSEKKFGFLRSLLWPVHRSELKKVLSMLVLLFLLCISYSVLRNLKDTIVLTAKHSGAEVIPFLKVWGMLPGALAATWIYTRLFRYFTRETVFYIIISSFITYFVLFAFVIHPNCDRLHLDTFGNWLTDHLPIGFKGMIAMIRNWTFTTFYIVSELWAVVVLTVLYWGFANDVTEVSEAKRTYGILNIGSNVAPILGGGLGILCGKFLPLSSALGSEEAWRQTLINIVSILALLGVSAMGVFYWINRNVIDKDKVALAGYKPKQKFKLSIRDSIRYISKSKYLSCLAIIVLGYNISINITDILWKEQLKRFFSDPNEMLIHMNSITVGIGIVATLGGLLFSMIVNRLGWTFTAILTPAIMAVMAVGFFTFLFCGDKLTAIAYTMFGASPFALTVYFGSLQNCLSKAGKYSLFDASKEIAFLPLDQDAKLKGKAAIDGLGSGLGKSGSSLTYQGLIILLGSVALSTPYIAVILFIVLVSWIASVATVGGIFKKLSPQENVSFKSTGAI
ncbi:MAG: NTP/NDP exchange transporter [Chlamydiae bacterium]|nr:NTP/NDP exchange transporter [Chlamydiota bacterium]